MQLINEEDTKCAHGGFRLPKELSSAIYGAAVGGLYGLVIAGPSGAALGALNGAMLGAGLPAFTKDSITKK